MTVKELINKLLDCKMDADAVVLVEIDKDTIIKTMTEFGNYSYPLSDDVEIKEVTEIGRFVRIELEEFKK